MPHNIDIIYTLTMGLSFALLLGFITQKMKLSPIVGYLIAGMIVGPHSPGIVADINTANQFAEIGIILLMFGIGLHFHLKDLLAVKNIAVPGALIQILATTLCSMLVAHLFGWSWHSGVVFGIAISVASTVVLNRVLSDNHNLHTPTGHTAIGWLIVEDLFTIFVLVLLPVFFSSSATGFALGEVFTITVLKLAALVVFVLAAGKKILPSILNYVARTGARDLFTLVILVLALGMAVGAAKFFGASMALGAFLAGLVVGQSDFSARAASEALPMRDAFAVLFFVSVGMLFNPHSVLSSWELMAVTLFIVLLIKPLAAIGVALLLKQPLFKAVSLGVALAQIGEFSFIVAGLGVSLGVLPETAANAIIVTSIISITLNPLLYKAIIPVLKFLSKFGIGVIKPDSEENLPAIIERERVIVVGYGPVGRSISRILCIADMEVVVIELNIDTVKEISDNDDACTLAVHGDASNRDILLYAGIENASALIVSASNAPSGDIVDIARELNPGIKILVHTTYMTDAARLNEIGQVDAFSGEAAAAREISRFLITELGVIDEDLENECICKCPSVD